MLVCSFKYLMIYVLIFSNFSIKSAFAKRRTRCLYYLAVQHKFNPKYISNFEANTTRDLKRLEIRLDIPEDQTRDYWVELVVYMKPTQAGLFRRIFQFDMNVCEIFKARNDGPFNVFLDWARNMYESGNMPMECPVKKGHYVWHIQPSENYRTHVLQIEGKYRINVNPHYMIGKRTERIINSTTLIEIVYK